MKTVAILINLVALFVILRGSWLVINLRQPPAGQAVFLDVGQGDAFFFNFPFSQWQMLIDTGPGATTVNKVRNLMPAGDRVLELVLITHPHADHYGGLTALLAEFKIETVATTAVVVKDAVWLKLEEDLKTQGTTFWTLGRGQKLTLNSEAKTNQFFLNQGASNFRLEVLAPIWLAGQTTTEPNQTSAVTGLQVADKRFLLMGDLGTEGEKELLADSVNLKVNWNEVDILKVGHHGSKNASSQDWLEAVRPKLALISVGASNNYGHPAPEALLRLKQVGAKIWRTDQQGDYSVKL